jgi:NADH-quinone oxidoreductase subunit J
MINQLFFGYFAFVIILTSLLVITGKNPVHSVLWMLLMFFHIAGMYLFLNAEFVAAIQIIVYAGAILVLFIFVIFLLNLEKEVSEKQFIGSWPIGLTVTLALLLTIIVPVAGLSVSAIGPWSIDAIARETNTKALGQVLYTEYLFPFELASLILLVAIVGAVMLAKGKEEGEEEG